MHTSDPVSMVAFFTAMALAAAIPAWLPRLPIPGVVFEIAFGVLLGPQILGIVRAGPTINNLSDMGLAVLFFIAGFEVDPDVLKGKPIKYGALGWLMSAGIGYALAWLLHAAGLIHGTDLTALALTTTAIGALLPVLRDGALLGPPYGPMVLAAGAVGEAGPIIALSLVIAKGESVHWQAMILLLFAASAVVSVAVASKTSEGPLARVLARGMGMSGQFPLRLSLLVMVTMVVLSEYLEIDLVLGAFVAGAVARAALPHHQHEDLMARLDGVGYGFLVPIFFLASGLRLDVHSLFGSVKTVAMIPLFAALMLIVRGVPAMLLYAGELDSRHRVALSLHCGTQLPLVVAISSIAVKNGVFPASQGAALVGAGVLTMILYPALVRTFVLRRPKSLKDSGVTERVKEPAEPAPVG